MTFSGYSTWHLVVPAPVNIAMSIIVADYMTSQLGAIDDSGVLCPYVTDRVHLK